MKMMVAVEAIKISDRITARVKEAEMKKTLQTTLGTENVVFLLKSHRDGGKRTVG